MTITTTTSSSSLAATTTDEASAAAAAAVPTASVWIGVAPCGSAEHEVALGEWVARECRRIANVSSISPLHRYGSAPEVGAYLCTFDTPPSSKTLEALNGSAKTLNKARYRLFASYLPPSAFLKLHNVPATVDDKALHEYCKQFGSVTAVTRLSPDTMLLGFLHLEQARTAALELQLSYLPLAGAHASPSSSSASSTSTTSTSSLTPSKPRRGEPAPPVLVDFVDASGAVPPPPPLPASLAAILATAAAAAAAAATAAATAPTTDATQTNGKSGDSEETGDDAGAGSKRPRSGKDDAETPSKRRRISTAKSTEADDDDDGDEADDSKRGSASSSSTPFIKEEDDENDEDDDEDDDDDDEDDSSDEDGGSRNKKNRRINIDNVVERVVTRLQLEQARADRRRKNAHSGTPVSHDPLDPSEEFEHLNHESAAPECSECQTFLSSYRQHVQASHTSLVDTITQEWIEVWFTGNFQLVRGIGAAQNTGEAIANSAPIIYSRNKFLKEEVNPFLRALGLSPWHVRTPLYKDWFLRNVMKQSEKELRKAGPFYLRRKTVREEVERQLLKSLQIKHRNSTTSDD